MIFIAFVRSKQFNFVTFTKIKSDLNFPPSNIVIVSEVDGVVLNDSIEKLFT